MGIEEKLTDAEQERETAIAERAYELFEARGGEPGHDREDWAEAESQLVAERLIEPGRQYAPAAVLGGWH
jgi:hypothetical protein